MELKVESRKIKVSQRLGILVDDLSIDRDAILDHIKLANIMMFMNAKIELNARYFYLKTLSP